MSSGSFHEQVREGGRGGEDDVMEGGTGGEGEKVKSALQIEADEDCILNMYLFLFFQNDAAQD